MRDFKGLKLGTPEVYIGRKSCGCAVALSLNITNTRQDRKATADAVAEFIRDGYQIEGHTLESSRLPENAPHGCTCGPQARLPI